MKVLTITPNPAVDKSSTIEGILPEIKLRCTEPHFAPGGGGINIARVLKRLNEDALAVFPSGGASGVLLQRLLEQEGIPTGVVECEEWTRQNLAIRDTITNNQYRFGMPGPFIQVREWNSILSFIEKQIPFPEFVVGSGSLPPGIPTDFYARVARIAKLKGARFIIDSSGDALAAAIDEGVYLMKPNLNEFSSLVGEEQLQKYGPEKLAKELILKGKSDVIVISMADKGAMLIDKSNIISQKSPVCKKLSSVGAGDSMVAGLVYGLIQNKSSLETLQMGIACGTAAIISPGSELCNRQNIDQILSKMNE